MFWMPNAGRETRRIKANASGASICRSSRKKARNGCAVSAKWLKIQKACPNTKLITIGDRESDVYELFLEATRDPDGPGLLVRMNRPPGAKSAACAVVGFHVRAARWMELCRCISRTAAAAKHETRFSTFVSREVELKPPKRLKHCGPIRAWASMSREQRKNAADGNVPLNGCC